jgi:hypothetical protein
MIKNLSYNKKRVEIMKFKKIMLIALLLLAVLTIGAASAADDVDVLAVEDAGDEAIVEAPVDEDVVEAEESSDDLSYPETVSDDTYDMTPEDFNVTFPTTEFDMDKGNPVVVKYFNPEGIHQYSSDLVVYYGEGDFDCVTIPMNITDVGTYKNLTWRDLYNREPGVYDLRVYYAEGMRDFLELGRATLNVTYNHEYTADEFIYIYDYVGNGEDEDCLAEIYDDEIRGLDGVVTAYANGNQIYSKSHSKSTRGGPIHANDLAGYFNGTYNIKVEYKRTDGKVFTVSKEVYFDNIVGGESISTKIAVNPTSVSIAYGTNKAVVATLTDANGNPIKGVDVYVGVMGMSYPLKTDKNGQVKQSLSSLPPKTSHVVTFTFKETAPYKGSSAKATVKVTKATPKLTATKKTFKKSVKTKKYTVTLKTNTNKVIKNAKVKLTVNKKTYTLKTKNNGKVTFKITNLKKKGSFKATVKFAGNSYYKAVSKTVKITVK